MDEKVKLGWQQFLMLCHRASPNINQLDALFDLLFAMEERETFATRVLLVKELLKGERTQREIAQYLNISIAKITRGSNALKIVSPELKKFILETE